MADLNRLNYYVRSYELDLPRTADYFQWEPQLVPHEYGPFSMHTGIFDAQMTSRDWCIVGDTTTDEYVLLGAVTAFRSFTYFTAMRDQGLFRHVLVCQPEIADGEAPEEVVALRGNDWRKLLKEYASRVAGRMSAVVPDTSSNSIGYCSWYYYYHNVTEQQFLANLDAIAANRESFPAKYIQIDDGYHSCQGDWLSPHPNWPSPLGDVVKRINDAGFEAGVWTMPFLAATSSMVYRDHQDWFVKDFGGEPLVVEGWSPAPDNGWACLDASNPEVLDHIRSIYTSFYDMGFRYFKLDGVGLSAPVGKRSSSGETGLSAFRKGMSAIRDAVKDSIILGCGAILPTIGFVDHCRVSTDTAVRWQSWSLPSTDVPAEVDKTEPANPFLPALENALKISLSHWWMYDVYFRADPDVIMARQNNTELTLGEARMSALLSILTGVAFTSDKLDEVTDERLRLLKLASELRVRDAMPVDWKQKSSPNVYEGMLGDKRAVAIFNLSDAATTYDLPDGALTELLHPLGTIEGPLHLSSHDAALIVEG